MKKTGICLALLCVLAVSGCTAQEEPVVEEKAVRTVQTTAVTTGEISSSFSYSGTVAPSREVSVVPSMAGKVTSYAYDVGNSVQEGAVLFTLDSTDLQNNMRSLEANYAATQLQVDNAKSQLESNTILYEEGILAKNDLDQLQLAYDSAQANLTSIQIQIENLQKNIDDCNITAPISGVISARGVEVGSFAGQSAPAYTIIDLSTVKVEVGVSEQMVNDIAVGEAVDVLLTAVSDEPFSGTVSTISPTATQTGTYTVKVTLNNSQGAFKPGMIAEVKFVTAASQNAMILPRDAVIEKDEETYVYVVENNVAKKVPVTLGIESGENVEITSGLTADMQVVTKGQTYISDGEEVQVQNPTEDTVRVPITGAELTGEGE